MISVNAKPIDFTSFPDGTTSFRYDIDPTFSADYFRVIWRYDGDHECILLWHLVNHIRSKVPAAIISLYMPYIPNARMDRVKKDDEVFTLKWFAKFINSMELDEVCVQDPHSDVSVALLDNVEVYDVVPVLKIVLEDMEENRKNPIFCFPDEGAAKRYSSQTDREYVFCVKHRDWRTGDIQGLELMEPEKVNGKDVLIVDDICSRGGTFTRTAKALKAAGAKSICLYVTHCENTIEKGDILTDGLIDTVYTTKSIYRGNNEKVVII